MCTYFFLRDVVGPGTLTLAANRDEALQRPFREPALVDVNGRQVLMPIDEVGGGTWLGTNGRCLAALTNAPREVTDAARRSRGLLVAELLGEADAAAMVTALETALEKQRYNGFNLLLADENTAVCCTHDDDGLQVTPLAAGLHVLHHQAPGADSLLESPAGLALDSLDGLAGDELLDWMAQEWLSSHEPLPFLPHGPCRHGRTRGTVAGTLLHLDARRPERSVSRFLRGRPCEGRWRDAPLPP